MMAASDAEIQRRLSAKRDCDRRRCSAETDEQTAAPRSVERSRSQTRRQAQKTDNFDIDNVACIGGLSSVTVSKVFF